MRAVVLGAAVAALSAGCFSPKLDPCALQCAAGNDCPRGTMCLADGFCHDSSGEALCNPVDDIDASVDPDADTTPDATPLPDAMVCLTACGNGTIDPGDGENCDDGNCDPGDGCSDVCGQELNFICINEPSECRGEPRTDGDVIVTEIFPNAEAPVGEAEGEWFEINNPTNTEWDLLGVTFSDGNTDSFTVDVNLPLPPGGTLLFAPSGNMSLNGGIVPDFVYDRTSPFVLSNTADEIRINARNAGPLLDGVDYNPPGGFPDPGDVPPGDDIPFSIALDPGSYDSTANNAGAAWCEGAALFGDGNGRGTPGTLNPSCP